MLRFFARLFWKTQMFLNRDRTAAEHKLPKGCFVNSFKLNADKPDDKIRIVPVGEFPEHPDGPHSITREHLEQMLRNQKTDIMIDLGHEAIWHPGAEAYGWINSDSLEVREDGLYSNYPEFTPDAEQMVQNRKYRFLSPAYTLMNRDKQGRQTGAKLYPISLTNRPYMDEEISHLRNSEASNQDTEDKMQYTDDFKKRLGLKPEATDEEVDARLDKLVETEVEAATNPASAETENSESESETVAANSAIENRLKALEEKQSKSDQDAEARRNSDAEAMVDAAIAAFKITPAQKKVWLNSAKADFEGTKKELENIKANSVKPQRTNVQKGDNGDGGGAKRNSVAAATDYLRAQGRVRQQ